VAPRLKAIGRRGGWFAGLGGEDVPCVHQHWLRALEYDDPYADVTDPAWRAFVEAIAQQRRVILTRDEVLTTAGVAKPAGFRRTGYVASYAVDQVRVEEGHLRFRLIKRLDDLE
jgi:hypothetical protein